MFVKSINEIVSPLPYMTDRQRYQIWREHRNVPGAVDTFNRMAWLGDEAIKRSVTDWLYTTYSSKSGADATFLHRMREILENRWTQLIVTVALGLDEEVTPPLVPLYPAMSSGDLRIKAYADILEAYIGGLYSQDRDAADKWISHLVSNLYNDLVAHLDGVLHVWDFPGHDFTNLDMVVNWGLGFGPHLVVKSRIGYFRRTPHITPMLDDLFVMTSHGHAPRLLPHPAASGIAVPIVLSGSSSPLLAAIKAEPSPVPSPTDFQTIIKAESSQSQVSGTRPRDVVRAKVKPQLNTSSSTLKTHLGISSGAKRPLRQPVQETTKRLVSGFGHASGSQVRVPSGSYVAGRGSRSAARDVGYFFPHGAGTMPVPMDNDSQMSSAWLQAGMPALLTTTASVSFEASAKAGKPPSYNAQVPAYSPEVVELPGPHIEDVEDDTEVDHML